MQLCSNVVLCFSIKKGRHEEAEQSLLRVFGSDYDAKQDVINISDNLQHLRQWLTSQYLLGRLDCVKRSTATF